MLALSLTVNHPAFQRATEGFADDGRVYLVYPDEPLVLLSQRRGGLKMSEGEAVGIAIQVCQAVSFLNRRGLRLNDICPQSIAYGPGGRVKLLGLDYVSNDTELQSDPIPNDGYTAPEVYRGKRVDRRADVFSIGALLVQLSYGRTARIRELARRGGSRAFLSAACGLARTGAGGAPRAAVRSAGAMADGGCAQGGAGQAECDGADSRRHDD